MCGIYKITNTINGKIYIGQSINIQRRWTNERTRAYSGNLNETNRPMERALKKYGPENFTFEVLEECEPSKLNEREAYWADYYNSYIPNGYNVARCGKDNPKGVPEWVFSVVELLKENKFTNPEIGEIVGKSWRTISDLNCGRTWRMDNIDYPIRKQFELPKNHCIDCGKEISQVSVRCAECAAKFKRLTERPSKEVLLKDIAESSWRAVGNKYGVSDSAIREWAKKYNLPLHIKDIRDYYREKVLGEKKIIVIEKKSDLRIDEYSLDDRFEKTFANAGEAAKEVGQVDGTHILQVCRGKRATCGSKKWKFHDPNRE